MGFEQMAPIKRSLTVEFVVGAGASRTLTLRDSQHEYVFEAA
jgi:hypothetical protein